jgi:hypothetical protein
MRREPESHRRSVALVSGVNVPTGVSAVAMDVVFAVECVFFPNRFIRSKAVDVDSERLLLTDRLQESNVDSSSAFAGITHRCPVPQSHRMDTSGLSTLHGPRPCMNSPREHDQEARSRPFFPAETYSSSVSTGASRPNWGASSASTSAGCSSTPTCKKFLFCV